MNKFKLRHLLIDRADLVDRGANQEAFIELYKRDGKPAAIAELLERAKKQGGPTVDKKKKRPAFLDGGDTEGEDKEMSEEEGDEKKVEKSLDVQLDAALEAVTKGLVETDVFVEDATAADLRDMLPTETLSAIKEVLKSAGSTEPAGESGMSEPSAVSATDLEELIEYTKKLEGELEDLRKAAEEPVEDTDIAKALADLPEDIAKAVEAERVELAKAREAIAEQEIAKADSEYVTKMEALPGIVDSPKEFGPVMRQIASLDADLAKSVEGVLEAANARIAKGDLFEELGAANAPASGGDAMEKATNIAKSMVEADPSLSLEEARGKVWETQPELYAEYDAERREAAK